MTTDRPHESGQPKEGGNPNGNPKTEQIKPDGDGVKRDAQNKSGK